LQDLQGRLAEIGKDQERLRQNLQAVPAQSELSARYHKKLAEQEDQIEQLQKQTQAAQQQQREQQKDLEAYLLSLDVQ
jgi:predicted RNase H-like nuclease (RuvC/YqgF family)